MIGLKVTLRQILQRRIVSCVIFLLLEPYSFRHSSRGGVVPTAVVLDLELFAPYGARSPYLERRGTTMQAYTEPHPVPTTLILDFNDSYTRNLLALFANLGALPTATAGVPTIWEHDGWEDRVVVVNVDSMTW